MIERLNIRLAGARDVNRIATMSRDLVESGPEWSWTPDRVSRALRWNDTIVPVACVGDAMAGFALIRVGFEEADLDLLAVRPGRRHHGIGRALVNWVEQSVLVAGVGIVCVQVRTDRPYVQTFFQSLGYQPWPGDSALKEDDPDAFIMAHDLWCPPVMNELH